MAVLAFAVLKFFAAARGFSRRHREDGSETAFMLRHALERQIGRASCRERG